MRIKPRRITVVTAGHLATCPRMVKAADALHGVGYDVRVISTSQTPWATAADRELIARRRWRWEAIAHDRTSAPFRWFSTGVRQRVAEAIAHRGVHIAPHRLATAAFSRMHAELVRAILREPCDFIYGGTSGALAAVEEAARESGTPFGLDIEDFHCGEHDTSSWGALRDGLAARIIAEAVRGARFVTAGSAAIGRACEERFAIQPLTINNVFPLPDAPTPARTSGDLRLYWFSQTVGAGRGLEEVIAAAGRARLRAELHLRGVVAGEYLTTLRSRAAATAPALRIVHHAPEHPDTVVAGCRAFDVGLAVEQGVPLNRALGLPNKTLTYPLAGLAMVLTNTVGQRPVADDLGDDAVVYEPGEIDRLADGLLHWAGDRRALGRAKDAAWEAARRRWHWEHPQERTRFLSAVEAAA
jgi:hypothetical protein